MHGLAHRSLNFSSLYPVKLKVEAITANTAMLLITAEGEAQAAAYDVKRTNRKTMKATGSRYLAKPGGVTRIHLHSLEPYIEYTVQVKPIKFANEAGVWTYGTSFKTLGGKKLFVHLFSMCVSVFLLLPSSRWLTCNLTRIGLWPCFWGDHFEVLCPFDLPR